LKQLLADRTSRQVVPDPNEDGPLVDAEFRAATTEEG